MKLRNEVETEKLLAGLEGVKLESLDTYLSEQGVIVIPHIGRSRIGFVLPDELFKKKNKKDFLDYINKGRISFLTKDEEAELNKLEQQVRSAVRKCAVGYDSKYVPIDIYKEQLKPFIDQKKVEYMERRDEIIAQWDEKVESFISDAEEYFKQMRLKKPVHSVQAMKKAIPTAKEFGESFYINLELKTFPVMSNLMLLDESVADDVKESIKADAINSVYDILAVTIGNAFSLMNRLLKNYGKRGEFTDHEINQVSELGMDINKKNILRHAFISEIIENCKEICECSKNDDDKAEIMEEAISKMYVFMKSIDMLDHLDLTETMLPQSFMDRFVA